MTAFCAGVVTPTVFISEGMLRRLSPAELEAVLLHEAHHARARDPLRRTMSGAACDVLFFLPLLRWWGRHRLEAAELAADRAVIDRLGAAPLAGALWATGSSRRDVTMVAFNGAAQARTAQLLGDPMTRVGPGLDALVASAAGLAMAVALASCLAHIFSALT